MFHSSLTYASVFRVLKQVHPDTGISNKAMYDFYLAVWLSSVLMCDVISAL
jgi:hypothetical protein